MRFLWSTTHVMPLNFLYCSTFTWHFLGQWHMACCYISNTVQKFDMRFPWSMTNGMPLYFLYYSEIWHEISLVIWHMGGCYIWHLHVISLVNDTWHAITFPIYTIQKFGMRLPWSMIHTPFRKLTWDFLGQWHMACHYISYKFGI